MESLEREERGELAATGWSFGDNLECRSVKKRSPAANGCIGADYHRQDRGAPYGTEGVRDIFFLGCNLQVCQEDLSGGAGSDFAEFEALARAVGLGAGDADGFDGDGAL